MVAIFLDMVALKGVAHSDDKVTGVGVRDSAHFLAHIVQLESVDVSYVVGGGGNRCHIGVQANVLLAVSSPFAPLVVFVVGGGGGVAAAACIRPERAYCHSSFRERSRSSEQLVAIVDVLVWLALLLLLSLLLLLLS